MISRLPAAALLAVLTGTAAARAQAPEDMKRARTFAEQASALLDQGKLQEALESLNQAQALFHAPTHQRMIAEAQIGLRRLVAAADTYETIASEPLPSNAPPAFLRAKATAKTMLRDLVARSPSLELTVRGPAIDGALCGQPSVAQPPDRPAQSARETRARLQVARVSLSM